MVATGWSGPSEGGFCFRFFFFSVFEVVGSTGWVGTERKKSKSSSSNVYCMNFLTESLYKYHHHTGLQATKCLCNFPRAYHVFLSTFSCH